VRTLLSSLLILKYYLELTPNLRFLSQLLIYTHNLVPGHEDEDRKGHLIMNLSKGYMYNVDPNNS